MTFTDGLTASAIILAVVAIVSEIVFFVVQTDRAAKSQREISDYVGQMRQVLGKIEGLTTSTREQLQEQFTLALKAAVGHERATLADGVAQRLESVEKAFADLTAKAGTGSEDELAADIGALKKQVASLSSDLSAVARKATEAAEPATDSGGRGKVTLAIRPKRTRVSGKVRIRVYGLLASPFVQTTCEVTAPDDETFIARFPGPTALLVFPDDFDEASSDVPGRYEVAVVETNTLDLVTYRAGPSLLGMGSFSVEDGGGS